MKWCDRSTLVSLCPFQACYVGASRVHLLVPAIFVSYALSAKSSRKDKQMNLKVRYDEKYQIITLDEEATEKLWINLDIESDEDLAQEEKEKLIQNEWDKRFNKPEYNNWHKLDRHKGLCRSMFMEDVSNPNFIDPRIDEVKNPDLFFSDELDRENKWDYDVVCDRLYNALKPDVAKMVIAIAIKGYSVSEYAAYIDDTPNNVSHRYRRALKKLKKLFK